MLEDTLTKAEHTLIESGRKDIVLERRRALQEAMRGQLVDIMESLSDRRGVAFLSDQQIDPDFAVESFVLEQLPHDKEGHGPNET